MHDIATAVTGAVFLLISGVSLYALSPREGRSFPWLEREGVAMTVLLILFVLGVLGVGLVIKAFT